MSGKRKNIFINKMLDPMLTVQKESRSVFDIIGWWEVRRFLYNFIVLVAGIISLTIMTSVYDGTLEPGEDFVEPFAIFGFAFLCNVFYSLGWLTEICVPKSGSYGPKMWKTGLYFTLFWVFLPAVLHIFIRVF